MTPLYVDLDGTIVRTDTSQHAWLLLFRDHPVMAVRSLVTLLSGRRHLAKEMVASVVDIDPASLPYRQGVLEYVKQARVDGRRTVLATGSHHKYADAVANHVGLFDAVFATDKLVNLIGPAKLATIRKDCDEKDFEYLGDSGPDLIIFEAAARAGVVGGKRFKSLANNEVKVHRLEHVHNNRPGDMLRLLRPTRLWKNLLVLLPIVVNPSGHDTRDLVIVGVTTILFAVVNAAEHVLDDLFSLEIDGRHPRHRHRPIPSGAVTIPRATILMTVLLCSGLLTAAVMSAGLMLVMLLYVVLMAVYILRLKNRSLLAAVALGMMWALRPVAGAVVLHERPNLWLVSSCLVLFTLLAFVTLRSGSRSAPTTPSDEVPVA